MSISIVRTAVATAVLVLAGCATTYQSDGLDASAGQSGILEHVDPAHSGVFVEQVDGKRHGIRPVELYRLTPGEHSLTARANVAFYRSLSEVRWFDVQPGGHYAIRTAADAGRWGFWIVDQDTGKRVDREWSTHRR
jgi:hypothetical protein